MGTRCGFIAVLGQANAGKSTLVNALVGEKVSIVSPKPHTTRYGIYGIVCYKESQLIFVDTPGFIARPQGALQTFMDRATKRSFYEADGFMVVVDVSIAAPPSISLIERSKEKPLVIVLNKVDKIPKERLLPLAEQYGAQTPHIAMTCATSESGVPYLREKIASLVPEGPWLFGPDDLTQISQRFWAAEITREKVMNCLHYEVPYHTQVVTEEWRETSKSLRLRQSILVDQEKYRKWILGYEGQRIRTIGQQARYEMGKHLGKEVHLFLTVLVDPQWTSRIALG